MTPGRIELDRVPQAKEAPVDAKRSHVLAHTLVRDARDQMTAHAWISGTGQPGVIDTTRWIGYVGRRASGWMETVVKPRICFIHIPKCGGTSIYNALRRHFPQPRIRHLDPAAARRAADTLGMGLEYRSHVLAYHLSERVDLVYGHYQVTATIMAAHPDVEFVTVLREPVARFLSNFRYNQSRPEWQRLFGTTLEVFLDGPDVQPRSLGHNYVRFLGLSAPHDPTSIEAAKRVLDRFALVGITERMDAFVEAFEARYGIRLKVGRDNVGPAPTPVSEHRLREIRQLCAPNIALYEHALSLQRQPALSWA